MAKRTSGGKRAANTPEQTDHPGGRPVVPAKPDGAGTTATPRRGTQHGLAPTPAAAPSVPAAGERVIKVRATTVIYHDHIRRRVGDVFRVPVSQFNAKCMDAVDEVTPERTTSPNESLKREHDDILAGRAVDNGATVEQGGAAKDDDEII